LWQVGLGRYGVARSHATDQALSKVVVALAAVDAHDTVGYATFYSHARAESIDHALSKLRLICSNNTLIAQLVNASTVDFWVGSCPAK
jgi:hypothetical protein